MVIESRWRAPIPNCSVPKWVFETSFGSLPETLQFADPEKPDTHCITKAGFRLWAKRFGMGLKTAGLKDGDRVLLFSGNNLFTPVVFMGTLMAGGVFTGANPGFVARELAYQLKDSGATFLVAAEAGLEVALDAANQAGLARDRVFSFDSSAFDGTAGAQGQKGNRQKKGVRHWTELLADPGEAAKWTWAEPDDARSTTCCLNYSSGTTGVPKGVEITHYSYVANGVGVEHLELMSDGSQAKMRRARHLCFLPMYHAYGQTYFTCILPRLSLPVYIMPAFDFERVLQYVQQFRITSLIAVPPILVALAKSPLSRKYDLSSLENVSSGAAPLSPEVSDAVSRLFPAGAIEVKQGWGMTEVTCTCMSWDPNASFGSSSVGEVAPNCAARLVRADGSGTEVTEPGVRGELWVTGPTLMKGYWGKPDATADTLHVDKDGESGEETRWLKTGDIAYAESYGPGALFHVVDRIKELIKVKGNQVAPAELEGVLLDHPAIADAAVVGVTMQGEELPRAYLVRSPSATDLSEKDIAKWMEGKVVRYKWLRGGVKFVDAVPKNPVCLSISTC